MLASPKIILAAAEVSSVAAAFVASLPVDKESVMEIAKWPATALLGGVACFCAWMLYKQSRAHAAQVIQQNHEHVTQLERLHSLSLKSHDDATKAINDLISELRNRPCLHRRHDI
jgi:uncharacterized membrane protein